MSFIFVNRYRKIIIWPFLLLSSESSCLLVDIYIIQVACDDESNSIKKLYKLYIKAWTKMPFQNFQETEISTWIWHSDAYLDTGVRIRCRAPRQPHTSGPHFGARRPMRGGLRGALTRDVSRATRRPSYPQKLIKYTHTYTPRRRQGSIEVYIYMYMSLLSSSMRLLLRNFFVPVLGCVCERF